MEIQWFSKKCNEQVSIYQTNITLNTEATHHFESSYKVIIGFDVKNSNLIIKSLNKEDSESGAFSSYELHDISIKKSYGRINGKEIIKNISHFCELDFSKALYYKYKCSWNESTKSLIIYMNEKGVIN